MSTKEHRARIELPQGAAKQLAEAIAHNLRLTEPEVKS
jgi:hypothetical protein